MRVVDGVLYMNFPLLSKLGGGRQTDWVSISGNAITGGDNGLGSTSGVDPGAMLDYLRGAGAEVVDHGKEDVRGVETTHMSTTIVPRQAIDSAPPAARDRMEKALSRLGAKGFLDTPVPLDVYVDKDGLVRRLVMQMTLPIARESTEMTMQMDFFDFGVPVDIEAPPADQVTDITSKLGRFTN
jgi:hypothetical protein